MSEPLSSLTSIADGFAHIVALSDMTGTFQRAEGGGPDKSSGYATDDVARLLVVLARQPEIAAGLDGLARTALRFIIGAQERTGECHTWKSGPKEFQDEATVGDAWGRSLWAFGAVVSQFASKELARAALTAFGRGSQQRSTDPRSMAFAALGAAEVLVAYPGHRGALKVLTDAAAVIGRPATDPNWPWVEARLGYENAVLAEALIAAGVGLEQPELVEDGLTLLRWLVAHECSDGHVSVVPVAGAGAGDTAPGFDQLPSQVAALADACARAGRVTGDPTWAGVVASCVAWFAGDNDGAAPMFDPATGGGFEFLSVTGASPNQGAASTIALLAALQHEAHAAPLAPVS